MDNRIYPTRWDRLVMWWKGITIEELYFKRKYPYHCFKHRILIPFDECSSCQQEACAEREVGAKTWTMPKAFEWPAPPPRVPSTEGDLP